MAHGRCRSQVTNPRDVQRRGGKQHWRHNGGTRAALTKQRIEAKSLAGVGVVGIAGEPPGYYQTHQ